MLKPLDKDKWNYALAAHLLNRAGFGGSPAQIQKLADLPQESAIASLLDYENISDPTINPDWAHPNPDEVKQLRADLKAAATPQDRRMVQQAADKIRQTRFLELRGWWLQRMARGSRPLQEKMVLFWHGHFATSAEKVQSPYYMWRQNELFRRLATGNWELLLNEAGKDPAMLVWLDQAQSRKEHPNENFAREVMELFALGEGHYTEHDITEGARALTGWSLDGEEQKFIYRPRIHDDGVKTFLGRTGNLDGDDVISTIVAQQAAKFITFRYEPAAIARVGAELRALRRAPGLDDVLAAASTDLDLGSLAQRVSPRFTLEELVLPPTQSAQIADIVRAMENLTRVHHEWGTARAWNEGGLAVLFSGPPGTGKTMAAEAVAQALALPMWRIDLSQVVNKYIGETEKNLRRVFDAADAADVILFFDEADALFGKRTEVRDAHDRYANLEISYLLERMERFKGLAILATNRRRDLDEAFARRLRFAVEFPVPGAPERLRLWRGAVPAGVDASDVDFDFLAQRFTLAGGHIRGVVFQACLLSAGPDAPKRLLMPAVIRALKREYDKLDRAVSLEQFGPYAAHVTGATP